MIRSALLAAAIVMAMPDHARAQLTNMPGMHNSPPAACRDLLALRDESDLYAAAIEGAKARKLSLATVCRYFRNYDAAMAKILRGLETYGQSCGIPTTIDHIKAVRAQAEKTAQRVCDAAWPLPVSDNPPPNFDDPGPPFRTYMPPLEKPRPLIIDPMPLKMGSVRQP